MLIHYTNKELKEYIYSHTVYECNNLLRKYNDYAVYCQFIMINKDDFTDNVKSDYDYCRYASDYIHNLLSKNNCIKNYDHEGFHFYGKVWLVYSEVVECECPSTEKN